MSKPRRGTNGYSALPADELRLVAEQMFAAKNYVLAAALFEAMGDPLSTVESGKLRYARKHAQQADERFASTAAVLPILFEGYRGQTLADVLGVKLGDAAAPAAERLIQVVYKPSFDPETIVSLTLEEGETVLSIAASNIDLWSYAYLVRTPDHMNELPPERLPPALAVHREQTVLDAATSAELWSRFAAVALDGAERNVVSLDGMSVEGSFRGPRRLDFDVHVARGGPGVDLARLLFEAASKHARTPDSVAALENLSGYFPGSGLPARVEPGPPRILRIFGRLGWQQGVVNALRELLSAIPDEEPLVIDLSRFRSMGTLFHPELTPLVQRSGPTAWIRSAGADWHLRDMAVDPTCVFATMTEARAYVVGAQERPKEGTP